MCDASVDSCSLAFFAAIMRFLGPGWIKLVILQSTISGTGK